MEYRYRAWITIALRRDVDASDTLRLSTDNICGQSFLIGDVGVTAYITTSDNNTHHKEVTL